MCNVGRSGLRRRFGFLLLHLHDHLQVGRALADGRRPAASAGLMALQLKEIRADEGPTFQRHQARARGRAAPIRKRTTHLTVVVAVEEEEPEEAA